MSKIAVVVVDVQRDFLDPTATPKVGSWEKAFCVPGVTRLLQTARERGWDVIHVGTRHQDRDTLPMHHRAKGIKLYCAEGSDGERFVVAPRDGEAIIYKHWYSAFDAGLEDYVDQETRIVWAGVAADCCIQQSAFEADRRQIPSLVPYQAVSASSSPAFLGSLIGMAKSVCDVVDLGAVTGDAGADASPLEPGDIELRAGAWYHDWAARLGDPGDATLEDVLERLR